MSKTQTIIRYMRDHKGITQMDAYELCKATRLGAIIFELKQRGYDIETYYYPNSCGIGKYAEYRLTKDCKERLDEEEKARHDSK